MSLMFCLCGLCACNNSLSFDVLAAEWCVFGIGRFQEEQGYGGFKYAIVNSREELTSLCDTWYFEAFDENSSYYDSTICKKMRECDQDFFEAKTLLIFVEVTGRSETINIKSINVEDNKIVMVLKRKSKPGYHNTKGEYKTFLVSIDKSAGESKTELIINWQK